MSDDEYEVETILRAKVEGGKRGKKKSWSYFVKWKNYGPQENTWEPVASFKGGSEHFIEYFWNRVDTQGRNIADIDDFNPGEELFPSGPPGKKSKKAKERKESSPPPIEISDSEHETPPPLVASGKKKGKKAQERQESLPPIVQPPDSEHEVGSLVNDTVEEPVASVSTRSKRRRSSVPGEKDTPRPKGKQGRPPGKRPHELEAELAGLQLEPVILDEPAPPPPKRKRGRPPGIPANEMGSTSRLQSEPVVDEPEPSTPKRKRGRPPGIPSHELEEQVQPQSRPVANESAPSTKRKRGGPPGIPSREMDKQAQPESEPVADKPSPPPPKRKRAHPPGISSREMEKQADKTDETEDEVVVVATSSKTKAASRRGASPKKPRGGARVVPDSRAESPRGRKSSADEPTTSAPRRLSLPRRRRLAKGAPPQKLPSADELLVVPDSDEEKGRRKIQRGKKGASTEDAMDVDALPEPSSTFGAPTLLSPDSAPGPSAEASSAPALPAHRLRAANPRVKVTDDPHLTDVNGPDAIEVKARFMKRAATNGADQASGSGRRAVVSGSKAGPGRSSATLFPENNTTRLMVQKGVLTSVKPKMTSKAASEEAASGDASMEIDGPVFDFGDVPDSGPSGQLDVEPEPEPEPEAAPTGQELLNVAGMDDKTVQDLPDFEEDAEGEVDAQSAPDAEVEVTEVEPPRAFGSISAGGGQPVDTPSVQTKPLTFASRVGMWSQSTIFGPLTLGLQGRSQGENGLTEASLAAKRYAFHLNLDSAVSVPIALKDVYASHTFLDGLDATARNPTGKFYKDDHAIALVDTLKAKASYARVTAGEAATDDHKEHLERFISRLQNGELFIQMNRAETLVMCASDNAVLGQKLGFPLQLLGLGSTVVVAHVDVEDFSQYAEAAVHADTTRW
ncbi:hypothetical protein V8D89_011100 [Ganoderma adspersum]